MSSTGPNKVDVFIGQRIRLRRLELNKSQSEIAKTLNVTFQQIQKFEQAQNKVSAQRLSELSLALDVPLTYFFEASLSNIQELNFDMLGQPMSAELLNIFYRLENDKIRASVLKFIRDLGPQG